MGMADQRGVFRLWSADIQHGFQASGGALEKKRPDLCHCSVYLVDHRVECARLVLGGKEVEIVRFGELQERAGRSGVSRHTISEAHHSISRSRDIPISQRLNSSTTTNIAASIQA